MTGENIVFGVYGVYVTLILLLVSLVLFKVKKLKYNKTLTILASLFSFSMALSALFNSEISMLFHSFIFMCLFLSTTVIAHSFFKESLGKVVTLTIILSHVPIIIFPLLIDGIDYLPYGGIFSNPNAFGIVVTTIFVVFLTILLSKIEKMLFYKEKPTKVSLLVWFLLVIFSFLLVIFSASRTSFVAGIVAVIAGLVVIFLFAIKHKQVASMAVKSLIGLPVLAGLYFVINKLMGIDQYLEEIIWDKFARKSSNVLDGRGYAWMKTAQDAGLFGNGENYFDSQVGLGAHNTFVYIMGVYGWIPMIIFSSFFIVALYFCVRFVLSSDHDYKYLPLIMLITLIGLSMGENLMYKITMVASFVLIGLAANNKRIVITK